MRKFVKVADKDGDEAVDFEEFKTKIEYYLRKVLIVFSNGRDGGVDVGEMSKYFDQLPLKLFTTVLEEVFDYFETDNNGFSYIEALGITNLINLQPPVFKFFQLLDGDQNKVLKLEEATNFLQQTFLIIDANKNCKISIIEVMTLLEKINVNPTKRLAVQVIIQKYTAILNFLLEQFVDKAETDYDGKISEEEVLNFSDFKFMDEMTMAAVTIGYPDMMSIQYLVNEGYDLFGR